MKRYSGRVMTKNPVTPTLASAPGIWTLEEAMQYTKAGTWPGTGLLRYSSRNTSISEGASSDFATNNSNYSAGWGYGGNNTDAITITTSGVSAILQGWTIGNNSGGTNSFSFKLAVISGGTTNGTILKQETFTSLALSSGGGSTMVLFSDGGIVLTPATYTLCFIWDAGSTTGQTRYQSGGFKTSSSISGATGTLGITYGNASFTGPGALATTNGTNGTGNGQVSTLQWKF